MKKLFLLLVAVVLSGCATTPVSNNHAVSVPPERVLVAGSGDATIIVTRDNGWFVSGGCYEAVTLNGKVYARIDRGETVAIKVDSGRYVIGISGDPDGNGICAMHIGQPIKENATTIEKGEIQKFRISGDTNSGLDIRASSI